MDAQTADPDNIRRKFWNHVENEISKVDGQRNILRRKYQNEHGCYIFTWGTIVKLIIIP